MASSTLALSDVAEAESEQLDPFAAMQAALDREGWIKHQFRTPDGVCLVGALEDVFGVELREDHDFVLLPLLLTDSTRQLLAKVVRSLWQAFQWCYFGEFDEEPRRMQDMLVGLATYNDREETGDEDIALLIKHGAAEFRQGAWRK